MPIPIIDFVEDNFDRLHKDASYNHRISIFLKDNRDKAFALKEIRANVKMSESGTISVLRRLKKEGLVKHKTPYYAWDNKIKSKYGKIASSHEHKEEQE